MFTVWLAKVFVHWVPNCKPCVLGTFYIWLRYGESGGGWPTIPVVPRRDTLHIQTRPTSGDWTRVFCNGRGGLVTRDPRPLWLTSQSPLEKSATKGHPPSRRRRPWDYFFGANMFCFIQEKVWPYIPPMWKKGHLCYLVPLHCFESPFNIKILGK